MRVPRAVPGAGAGGPHRPAGGRRIGRSGWLLAFGVVPAYRHTIEVVTADEGTGTIATHEHGGVLRAWDHTLQVEPLGPGRSRYRDTVRIDAGRLTPLVATLAVGIYRYRQRRWRALARRHLAVPPPGADPTCTGGVPGV